MSGFLYVICEGKSEQFFVKNVLSTHLPNYGWDTVTAINLKGWRRSGGYNYAIQEIKRTVSTHKGAAVYTTFFDLYGFPTDIPCREQAEKLPDPLKKARLYEKQIKQSIDNLLKNETWYNPALFIPYVQPYEFEAFLSVDPKCSANKLLSDSDKDKAKLESALRKIKQSFETPEHINNSPETAPSKRLEELVPKFRKNKAGRAGFSWRIPESVGIEKIRTHCLHFNEWLTSIEQFFQA